MAKKVAFSLSKAPRRRTQVESIGGVPLDELARIDDEVAERFSQLPGAEEAMDRTAWIIRVGRLLRAAREMDGRSQPQLSERTRIPQPYMSRIENGLLSRGPTLAMLKRYLDALGCECELVVRRKDDATPVGSASSSGPSVRATGQIAVEDVSFEAQESARPLVGYEK